LFLFISYTTFMMGVVDLPLSQVEAIRFSGPVMIMILSIFFLREKVALYRWIMLAAGLAGVTLIIRPGAADFNSASLLILLSVFFYALTVLVTRKLKETDSSGTMAFYSSAVYLVCALILTPVTMALGEQPDSPGSIAFLFTSWTMPTPVDGLIMCSLGLVWAGWTYSMTKAYSLAQASVLAGYEYLSLPINAFWGFLIWKEIPAITTWAGSLLIILGGLSVVYMNKKYQRAA
ncbi:MAG: DMT family transporter, partial [Spirochaetales bacterium]|nr:DMT family transporter [Spirochaetales bacterium]